ESAELLVAAGELRPLDAAALGGAAATGEPRPAVARLPGVEPALPRPHVRAAEEGEEHLRGLRLRQRPCEVAPAAVFRRRRRCPCGTRRGDHQECYNNQANERRTHDNTLISAARSAASQACGSPGRTRSLRSPG